MKTDNLIKQLSSKIDNLLDVEKKINDSTCEDLRKLVTEMLEYSYKKAREDAGFGLGGNIVGLVINVFGALASRPDMIKTLNSQREEYDEKQNEIGQKWYAATKRLASCSVSDLYWVLYLDRKNGFMSVLTFLLSSN